MLHDDRPDYPMSCAAEFSFDGQLDRSKFESAVEQALLRHPLLRAHIEHRRGRPWRWIAARTRPQVQWIGEADPAEYTNATPIDLRREVGMRIWVQEKDSRTKLIFEMHHACSDAAGGMIFVEDLLTLYAASFPCRGGRKPELRKLDPSHLQRRGQFAGASGISLQRLLNDVVDLRESYRFFSQRPQPIAERSVGPMLRTSVAAPRRFVGRSFADEFLRQLRHTATASGASLNDLLVQALMLSIGDWNQTQGDTASRDWLRVVIPTNLRTRADLQMPAANRLSNLFITRRMSALSNRQALLKSISLETGPSRRDRLSHTMISKLGILNAVRFGIPALFSRKRCLATAVLSNIGDPTRRFQFRFPRDRGRLVAGNVALRGINAIPPIRPLTRLAMLINTYGGRLTVGMRLDPAGFSPADGSQFLDTFARYLNDGVAQIPRLRRAA